MNTRPENFNDDTFNNIEEGLNNYIALELSLVSFDASEFAEENDFETDHVEYVAAELNFNVCDIHFNDPEDSSNKGFNLPYSDALSWIDNSQHDENFTLYAGGTVSIVHKFNDSELTCKPI